MSGAGGWSRIEAEAAGWFTGEGRFALRAYSELMPPPYVGVKPYDPRRASDAATAFARDEDALDVTEYEQAHELAPGLAHVAAEVVAELAKLTRGDAHALSRTLLADNPAWPPRLAEAAAAGRLADDPIALLMPLALSRTQDDKGNDRWTLFGASHDGPHAAFFRSFGDAGAFARVVAWAAGVEAPIDSLRVLADPEEVPAPLRDRLLGEAPLDGVRVLVTFRPFAALPEAVQAAYLARRLVLVPTPASLLFFEHPRYRELARALPEATQIPLLHLFPRVEGGYALRIPQSGWLDEHAAPGDAPHGHRVVPRVHRTHRWQRVARDHAPGDAAFADEVTVALFSTKPDDVGLYGKPMARNAQVWRESYQLLLDGPRATRAEIERAAEVTAAGGRFGYRFYFPPMRAGARELYWHRPLVARLDRANGRGILLPDPAPLGYVSADPAGGDRAAERITLAPRLLARPGHREAATLFPHDPGHLRLTTCGNARKLLEAAEQLGGRVPPSLARALLRVARDTSLDQWIAGLPEAATDRDGGARLAAILRAALGEPSEPGPALTFDHTSSRAFEESLWRTIASLAEGEFRSKENADAITVNRGKTGGPAGRAAHVAHAAGRDLDRLGDHLHERYRGLIARHGMAGAADVVDQRFPWESDFLFAWSEGWSRGASGEASERNVVVRIPGRRRDQAVIMADHYDTAYMEDVYETERGGDGLRAAARGADDNHSATTALLHAADVLLPMARAGRLERDVWLVHLTGEEFPADCMGARALGQALVERRLAFTHERGGRVDAAEVRVTGAFVLDMIAHNIERDRDVFQIAPGEGAGSARLALAAHLANLRWNEHAARRNRAVDRAGKGRAARMPDGAEPPPPFEHLAVSGEVRVEWEPRSSLYNTDGQIFSDLGIPVVLFMENYDINRAGYHDTHDTMKNIDLDYAAAVTAIAIEAVAMCATAP